MFDDLPCFSACQLLDGSELSVNCIGEDLPSQKIINNIIKEEKKGNDWAEMERVILSSPDEGNVSEIYMCSINNANNTTAEASKNDTKIDYEDVKKGLTGSYEKISIWVKDLQEHLYKFNILMDSDVINEKLSSIGTICTDIKNTQSTLQNNFELLEPVHKDVSLNQEFWFKILEHTSSSI